MLMNKAEELKSLLDHCDTVTRERWEGEIEGNDVKWRTSHVKGPCLSERKWLWGQMQIGRQEVGQHDVFHPAAMAMAAQGCYPLADRVLSLSAEYTHTWKWIVLWVWKLWLTLPVNETNCTGSTEEDIIMTYLRVMFPENLVFTPSQRVMLRKRMIKLTEKLKRQCSLTKIHKLVKVFWGVCSS